MTVTPGDVCPTCDRKVPHTHDKPPGPKRTRFSVAVPPGEEGILDELLVQLVEKMKGRWPDGGTMELGDQGWRYRAVHYAITMVVMDDRLLPSEVGG